MTTSSLKARLRKEIGERLARLDDTTIAAHSAAVQEPLHALIREKFPTVTPERPLRVGLYASFPRGELSTDALVASLFNKYSNNTNNTNNTNSNNSPSVHLYFPRIAKLSQLKDETPRYPGQTSALQFLRVPSLDAFRALEPRGRYKIREPAAPATATAPIDAPLDLLVVPGVAFAYHGDNHDTSLVVAPRVARLGHGAGYYDDFLARHRARFGTRPLCVGLALPEQLLPEGSLPLEAHDELLDALLVAEP